MLQAHVQEHIGMMARDQVTTFFQKTIQEAQLEVSKFLKLIQHAVEAAIAQQVGEILNEIMPALATTEPDRSVG